MISLLKLPLIEFPIHSTNNLYTQTSFEKHFQSTNNTLVNRPNHRSISDTFCRMFILELMILAMSLEENFEGVTLPAERMFLGLKAL